jgi:alanyl aminopeptidase
MRRHLVIALATLLGCPAAPPPNPPPRPTATAEQPPPPPPRDDGRLPPLATPIAYRLAFDVDPKRASFRGTMELDVDVPAPTYHVVLDARGLVIHDARALTQAGPIGARTTYRAAHGDKPETPQELVVTFAQALPAGRATIALAWSGEFDHEMEGLYRVEERYAFTQFEATSARRAFPCFDEPGYKTPYEVTVTTPRGMIAVGNAPEVERKDAGDRATFRFALTPPMPSYLVAIAVGDFDVVSAERFTNPPIRLIAPKGRGAQGALGLEATSALVDALGKWFGIPYPYAKLDIVAVPEFTTGAMENAGLITFREELLLLDPARASVRARRSQALVVAHELAHQWFGNLVTAAWWNDLWLNEGMATWMEARIVDTWRPAWGARVDAVVEGLGVMDTDALASARAVRQPVASSAEAEEAFDGITYAKGAAVLATIEQWVGEAAFQRGVRAYLTENSWKNATADVLMSALDRATGKNVTQMAATFLERPGVPVVTAKLTCERGSRWSVELGQEPWRPIGSQVPEDETRAWMIPVCAAAAGEKKPLCAELALGAPSLVAGRGCPAWIHPNAFSGYYRFALAEPDIAKLARARKELDVPERVTLLSNTWAGVRAGKTKPKAMLDTIAAFDDETSRQVVEQIIAILYGMSDTLVDDAVRAAFQKLVVARLAKHKKALGWTPSKAEGIGGDEAILRRDVLWALGDLGEDEVTLKEAEELAQKWLADPASVDSDMAAVAVDLASRRAGLQRFEQLRAAAKQAKTDEDRIIAIKALVGFDDPSMLEKALELAVTDEIRVHDMRYVLGNAFYRRKARVFTEKWVREHWDAMRKKLPGSLAWGLFRAAGVACTKSDVEERTAFYLPRLADVDGAARSVKETLEAASLCAELRTAQGPAMTKALADKK